MYIDDFIALAKRFRDLGDSVQDQMEKLLTYGVSAELNPNAVRYIGDFAKVANYYDIEDSDLLSDSVKEWLENYEKENAD